VACWFYVLRSGKDGRLYKGVTQDLERRLAQHNAGKTKSLRHRRPFTLVYREKFASREDAMARERWSKTPAGGKRVRELVGDAGSPARAGEPGTG